VAERLRVERDIAKVAVLGAMYGQTTGKGAEALRGLEREYPTAMGYLRAADESAQGGRELRTYGGRRIRMSGAIDDGMSAGDVRSRAAARGRYGRNAVIQGAAAEFFKTWAALVRARGGEFDARIVLCLHDELVVHVPAEHAEHAATVLGDCLTETAFRWSPPAAARVRFVADTSIVARWSDAK
jgi:DNA polymerase-1